MQTTNADFNFFMPIEFEKAQNKKGEKIMKIKGIASTADQDSDGEILDPVGFDLSRFLSTGFLNWNHQAKNDASKIVGEPTMAKITPKGDLYVEGTLYNGHPLAESIWSMAETLERNGSSRRIGFSIEGRATERDIVNPKKITKALLTGLAITPTPVNTNTFMDLCKGEQKEDWIEYEDETILEKSETSKYIFEFSCDGKNFGITKSFTVEEIEKDMNTSNMAALAPESLDKKVHILEPNIKKAILGGIIPLKWVDRIEKGGSRAVLGEIRKFGGRDYIKTAEGWKFHGKGTGAKAQEHKAGAAGSSEKKEEGVDFKTGRFLVGDVHVTVKKTPKDTEDTFTVETHKSGSFKKDDKEYIHETKSKQLPIEKYKEFMADLLKRGGVQSQSTEKKEEEKVKDNSVTDQYVLEELKNKLETTSEAYAVSVRRGYPSKDLKREYIKAKERYNKLIQSSKKK